MKLLIIIFTVLSDLAVLAGSLPVLRMIMVRSPLFDATAPQWSARRYLYAGLFAAITYFLLALTSGFYSSKKMIKCAKVPVVNFALISYMFFLGLLACWRYGIVIPNAVFISKRALLLALVISYFVTTSIHYLTALYFNKEKS